MPLYFANPKVNKKVIINGHIVSIAILLATYILHFQ